MKRDDIYWRALALFLAVVLWFVATEGAQRNAGLEVRHTTVELNYTNIQDDLELAAAPTTVEMTIEGPRLILPFQIRDVAAIVDLSQLGPGTHSVPVRIELPSTISLKSFQPHEVQVVLEERVRQRLAVTVSVEGVPPGMMVHVVEARPDEVEVYGSASAVASVSAVLARVDVISQQSFATLIPVDVQGARVDTVMLSSDTVEVILDLVDSGAESQGTEDARGTPDSPEPEMSMNEVPAMERVIQ